MTWLGKLVGTGVGFALGGPLWALAGVAIGHGMDRWLSPPTLRHHRFAWPPRDAGPDHAGLVRGGFLHPTFAVMGHLAKADGRVSEREIAVAEAVMTRLRLTVEQRRLAIDYFNEGKSQVLVLDQVLATLRQDCRGRGVLLRLFLDIQFQMAYADGPPGPVAKGQLLHIARHAGVSDAVFQGLDQMASIRRGAAAGGGAKARGRAGRGGAGTGHAASGRAESALAAAYALLGVPSTASESEVKRAYRRLLSQHHPDKLVSRGASPDMLKRADERTHQIRRAYETITQARAA